MSTEFQSVGKIRTCGNWDSIVKCLHPLCFYLLVSFDFIDVLFLSKQTAKYAAKAADRLGCVSVSVSECVSGRA